MLILLSLSFILLENNLAVNGTLLFVSLTFLSYLISLKKNFLYIIIVYFLVASQTNSYFYIFLILLLYTLFNFFISLHIEYNEKSIVYYIPLQIITYIILNYNFLTLKYLSINILGIILFNYVYIKFAKLKENKNEIKK